jgi:hypothetical protein
VAAIATELQQTLGARLAAAINDDGVIGAIDVCNVEAPEIAARLSASAGAHVGRTSLKVRNPDNEPDDDARRTLELSSSSGKAAKGLCRRPLQSPPTAARTT